MSGLMVDYMGKKDDADADSMKKYGITERTAYEYKGVAGEFPSAEKALAFARSQQVRILLDHLMYRAGEGDNPNTDLIISALVVEFMDNFEEIYQHLTAIRTGDIMLKKGVTVDV